MEWQKLADRRLQIEFQRMDESYVDEIGAITARAAGAGVFQSTGHAKQLLRRLKSELRARGTVIVQQLVSILSTIDNPDYDAADDYARGTLNHLAIRLQEKTPTLEGLLKQFKLDAMRAEIDRTRDEVIEAASLDLEELSRRRRLAAEQGTAGTTVNVYGSQNLVAAGIRSSTVTMQIDQADREPILEALEQLKNQIAAEHSLEQEDRVEILDIIEDISVELRRVNPNKRKLAGLVATTAAAVQIIPGAQQSWSLLRTMLLAAGFPVP